MKNPALEHIVSEMSESISDKDFMRKALRGDLTAKPHPDHPDNSFIFNSKLVAIWGPNGVQFVTNEGRISIPPAVFREFKKAIK